MTPTGLAVAFLQTQSQCPRQGVQDPNWAPFAAILLSDPNWRPHLVACVALIYEPREAVLPALWQAFDEGSWVAPQLAVAGYFSDAKFVERQGLTLSPTHRA